VCLLSIVDKLFIGVIVTGEKIIVSVVDTGDEVILGNNEIGDKKVATIPTPTPQSKHL
jgi:hypothetical protein